MKDEMINTVRIQFDCEGDLVMTKKEYEYYGGWKGCVKDGIFNIRDVIEVHHELIKTSDLPTEEWSS